VFIFYQVI